VALYKVFLGFMMKPFLNMFLNWKNLFRMFLSIIFLIDVAEIFLPHHPLRTLTFSALSRLSMITHYGILPLLYFLIGICTLFLIIYVVSLIGLWIFWKSARELFIIYYISVILSRVTLQPTIRYWWDLPISIIYNVICIALIVFSYSSYTKKYFNKDKSVGFIAEDLTIDNVSNVA
jgi:hypothetical protein